MARQVDKNFDAIFRLLETRRDSIPPLTLPLKDMSYVQMGASVGMKQNPLYKRPVQHDGLDLIAPQGAPVYAAASGTVSQVIRSRRGLGNILEIDHGNGYTTRYCLLADMNVSRGMRVRRGQKIGTVGISSTIAAAHLHFEVLFKGAPRDPVHYLFASLSPEDYAHMVYMATATSHFVLAASSAFGVVSHFLLDHIIWLPAICISLGAAIGAQIGAKISKKTKSKVILALLSLAMFALGCSLILMGSVQ
jgi:hypothetical protein